MSDVTVKYLSLGEAWGQEHADCQDGATLVVATRVERVDGREVVTGVYMGDWAAVSDIVFRWLTDKEDY